MRAATGAVYVALVLGAAWAGPWTTFLLFLPVSAIAAREWHRLAAGDYTKTPGYSVTMALAVAAYTALAVVPMLPGWNGARALAALLALLLALAFDLMRRGVKDPARIFSLHIATVAYIAVPFACVTHLVHVHWHVFTGFMLLLWTNDTGAYLTGRAIGRHKLMPAVSPGKTWEGLLGGIALTLFMGWLISRGCAELSPAQWIAAAVTVTVASTVGDLLESALKRARGVKDSGSLLPGHGGILDRFDGFLLAAPVMWAVVTLWA